MKQYFDTENDRYHYYIRPTVNGYSVQVMNTSNGETVPLVPQVAAMLQVRLPDTPLAQSCAKETAEHYLDELAELNGWFVVR